MGGNSTAVRSPCAVFSDRTAGCETLPHTRTAGGNDRTAVKIDRSADGKSTALRSESTALIDRTAASAARHRPHCCARRTAAVAKARTGSRKASAEREVHASDWLKEDAH